MTIEKRRSVRYADFMPITVSVIEDRDKSRIAGPFSARIIDISNHGVCLLMTHVMMHSFHIFHSTREDESTQLQLHLPLAHEHDAIELVSRPVWLNTVKIEDIRVFKMGIEFSSPLDNETLQKINKMNTIHRVLSRKYAVDYCHPA